MFLTAKTLTTLLAGGALFSMLPAIAGDDIVFADGFDGAQPSISNFDDLVEGSLETS